MVGCRGCGPRVGGWRACGRVRSAVRMAGLNDVRRGRSRERL